ncbi:hypothetical protein B7494_g1775 [Chlorociboria aeruginascens]|nr:hypothetical protein B7494_g1775 [Chlorociboria aeruginascens]
MPRKATRPVDPEADPDFVLEEVLNSDYFPVTSLEYLTEKEKAEYIKFWTFIRKVGPLVAGARAAADANGTAFWHELYAIYLPLRETNEVGVGSKRNFNSKCNKWHDAMVKLILVNFDRAEAALAASQSIANEGEEAQEEEDVGGREGDQGN